MPDKFAIKVTVENIADLHEFMYFSTADNPDAPKVDQMITYQDEGNGQRWFEYLTELEFVANYDWDPTKILSYGKTLKFRKIVKF